MKEEPAEEEPAEEEPAEEEPAEEEPESQEPEPSTSGSSVDKMIAFAKEQLGKPYVYSREGPSSFDCSGFVYYVLKNIGISTRRYSAAGFSGVSSWTEISSLGALKEGDLMFWKSDSSSRISHTGIYLGDGKIIHASSSGKCVKISDIAGYLYKKLHTGKTDIRLISSWQYRKKKRL